MAALSALTTTRRSFVVQKAVGGTVTVRKNANFLSDEEVANYRLAVYRAAGISADTLSDSRGFQALAGIHGIPQGLCQHGTPAFALWHRPYVQAYEQALQDLVPTTFVPYWDWSNDTAIPQIFLDPTWDNPDSGATEANPLLAQPVNGGALTTRRPGTSADLARMAPLVAQALLASDYDAFAADLENPHNQVHGWVGGTMGFIGTSAFDPLFWSHHAYVEYVFCQWQDAHTAATQPSDVSTSQLTPFGVTVDRIWKYRDLGYVYEAADASTLALGGAIAPHSDGASLLSGSVVASFALDRIAPNFNRAEVRFEGLTLPEKTFELRIFANEPNADASTATLSNPHYLGSQFFFGHGGCFGAPGHCEPVDRDIFDLRPKHHYAPVKIRLNVTERLRASIAQLAPRRVGITLVAVGSDGKDLSDPGLHFEGLTFVIR